MAPEPKPSEVAIVPKTFGQKMSNIWYHYKWAIVVGFLVAVLLTVCTVQCARRVDADLKIIIYGHQYIDDTGIEQLAEKYVDDINKDGKKKVEIINCSYNASTGSVQYSSSFRQKMTCMITAENSALLYICDRSGYDDYMSHFADLFLGEPVELNETFYGVSETLPEGLLICCRNADNPNMKKDKHINEYFENSQRIYKALTEK